MQFIKAVSGRYAVAGNPAKADCIMGHSFGTDTSIHSVNRKIAELMHQYADGRPLIADRHIVLADPNGEKAYAHVIDGQITQMDGQSGTGKALLNAQAYMAQHSLKRPLMIAQRYHIDRVVKQAHKLGISSIVPGGLPSQFDKNSKQVWTRSLWLFIPANLLAYIKLKIDGDI